MRRGFLIVVLATGVCVPYAVANQQPSAVQQRTFDQLIEDAEKARQQDHRKESIRLFRRAISEQPESEQALWYLGTLLYEEQQYAEARDWLRQFVTLRPDAGPAWALLGLSEFQSREYPRALDHLQRAIAEGMGDRKELAQSVFYHVVILLTRFERYDDSMALLEKVLSSGPPDPAFVEPAGLVGLRLPLLPAEIPPDLHDLVDQAGQAVLAMETDHDEEAKSKFAHLVAAYPNQPGVAFLDGEYLARSHPKEAVHEFERELEISPSHVLARVRLADLLMTSHDYDRALSLVRQVIKLDPKRASAHMLAGEALLAKGDTDEGIKELETARDIDPSVVRTHWDLLRAYMALGRKEEADREKGTIEKLSDSSSPSHPPQSGNLPREPSAPQRRR